MKLKKNIAQGIFNPEKKSIKTVFKLQCGEEQNIIYVENIKKA